ncbi:hypothetical protein HDF16_002116 [Granulicella aggregans]|uniref:Uncharacterized protein n=1 Tax=Granulicella aggregans TaxID=474949 RepID=A0A7W8E4Q6_9BACT|nr:hypothetical protein [Granulicella aggregans]
MEVVNGWKENRRRQEASQSKDEEDRKGAGTAAKCRNLRRRSAKMAQTRRTNKGIEAAQAEEHIDELRNSFSS